MRPDVQERLRTANPASITNSVDEVVARNVQDRDCRKEHHVDSDLQAQRSTRRQPHSSERRSIRYLLKMKLLHTFTRHGPASQSQKWKGHLRCRMITNPPKNCSAWQPYDDSPARENKMPPTLHPAHKKLSGLQRTAVTAEVSQLRFSKSDVRSETSPRVSQGMHMTKAMKLPPPAESSKGDRQ